MAAILVTGMSGTGKSTAINALAQQGYLAVDTDYGDWIEPREEPQWREDRIDTLLTEHERSDTPLLVAGTVWNQTRFYPRFDEIVLLSAPVPVMLERIAARNNNTFGKSDVQRAQIMADTAEFEPLLRTSATMEIDTRRPLDEVVALLAAFV